jgi:hypothetical protein
MFRSILFFEIEYSKLINCLRGCAKLANVLQYMECLESKILKFEMFEFRCVNIES